MYYYRQAHKCYKRDITVTALIWAVAILLGTTSYQYLNHWAQGAVVKRAVYNVCEHTRTTDALEDSCGIIQDSTHTEYLCTFRTAEPTNDCWVEQK